MEKTIKTRIISSTSPPHSPSPNRRGESSVRGVNLRVQELITAIVKAPGLNDATNAAALKRGYLKSQTTAFTMKWSKLAVRVPSALTVKWKFSNILKTPPS